MVETPGGAVMDGPPPCAGAGQPGEVTHPESDVMRLGVCPVCEGVVDVEADSIVLPHESWTAARA